MAGLMSRSRFLTVPCSLVPRERYGVTHIPLLLLFCLSSLLKVRSSVLAWKIPWTEEPCGLQSMGSWRVRTLWAAELVCACTRVSVVFTPASIPVCSHHGTSSTLSCVHGNTWASWGRRTGAFSAFSADFPLWLCSSPMLVLTGNALLWAFCLYKLDLACYGSAILFWLSLWYSAFCRR